MATIDRVKARAAGYTDAEIDAFEGNSDQTTQSEPVVQPPTPQVTIDKPAALQAGYTPEEIDAFESGQQVTQPTYDVQSPIAPVDITQSFNQPSQYDVFSGGVNTGVDYATKVGTPVNLPEGDWQIEDAFADADPTGGYIGNYSNQGYGNSVVARNRKTGEKIRLSHLSKVNVQPGQEIPGGLIGETGASGNVTGSHLDAEYYDQTGQMADILQSPYGNIIPHN